MVEYQRRAKFGRPPLTACEQAVAHRTSHIETQIAANVAVQIRRFPDITKQLAS